MNVNKMLSGNQVETSVPCRVDLGGTLDISTLYLSMGDANPSSFNIALDMRTRITVSGFNKGKIKISSRGFNSAIFNRDQICFDHPMGLMFACANYFNAHGVHIHIESSSPPRSALGGSSAAAVGIIAAFLSLTKQTVDPARAAWLAHYIEASVAGVPCGMQDQLAAAFGGINQWIWKMGRTAPEFEQKPVFTDPETLDDLNSSILIAYCGIPHVSKNINSQWIQSFIKGDTIGIFKKIAALTQSFTIALKERQFEKAADLMNQETSLRLDMTPDVLDDTGQNLFKAACSLNCGARFTGAGGGGCIWAVGDKTKIAELHPIWEQILDQINEAKILDTRIDPSGIRIEN